MKKYILFKQGLFRMLILVALLFAKVVSAQVNTNGYSVYTNGSTTNIGGVAAEKAGPGFRDSIGPIVLKPTILHSGGVLFVDQYRRQPFTLNFYNASGARVGTYLVRDNYFQINTSGWGRGIYFYSATDAYHPFIDSGKILVL